MSEPRRFPCSAGRRDFAATIPSAPVRALIRCALALAALACLALAPACGKKSPPEIPIKVLPLPCENLAALQHGRQVTLGWLLPEENTDGEELQGVARVELFRWQELLKPPKKGEEEEDYATAVGGYDVLAEISQSFLPGEGDSAEDDSSAYGFGGYGGEWSGSDKPGGGAEGGGFGGSQGTGMIGGGASGGSQTRTGSGRGWAGDRMMRGPRVTPGFNSAAGKFISARKFEKVAERVYTATSEEVSLLEKTGRMVWTDELPALDEEMRKRARFFYAVRVIDTLEREGLFSTFLMVRPLAPPRAPEKVACTVGEKSVDLAWEGPEVDHWVKLAWEKQQEALAAGGLTALPETLPGGAAAKGAPPRTGAGGVLPGLGAPRAPGALAGAKGSSLSAPRGPSGPGGAPAAPPATKKKAPTYGPLEGPLAPEGPTREGEPAEEERAIGGWVIQPPGTFLPRQLKPLLGRLPDPWPLGSQEATAPYIAGYNVYRRLESDTGFPALPLNPAPLVERTFTDVGFTLGQPARYVVRTLLVTPFGPVESADSEPVLVSLSDTFAPITPVNLTFVATEGVVTLIWTPNGEPDLAGYHVYRRSAAEEAAGAAPVRLTAAALAEPRYRDESVVPGTTYSYLVSSVDLADPPNESKPTEPLGVTAR